MKLSRYSTFRAGAFVLALFGAASTCHAEGFNTPLQGGSGSQAEIARLRAYGDSFSQSSNSQTNVSCQGIQIGSTTTAPATPSLARQPAFSQSGVANVQQPPQNTEIVTGNITNICFSAP